MITINASVACNNNAHGMQASINVGQTGLLFAGEGLAMAGTRVQFLAGDIGGTRLRLRVVETDGDGWQIRHQTTRPSRDFESLETAVQCFLDELSRAERCTLKGAWLAVAGPVINGRVCFTNLPWQTDNKTLASRLSLPEVHMINDLEAQAYVIPALDHKALVTIQPGSAVPGRGLLVAVGTGLGLASWSQVAHEIHVVPSEGGHSDFAPATEWQSALWHWLRSGHHHVSYERVVSGPGLVELYNFLHVQSGARSPNEGDADRAAQIVHLADTEGHARACDAIDHFARILGAFCGNAALHTMATGGVYLAGGVIRNLHPYLRADTFTHAFSDKGRMAGLLRRIPVHVITIAEPGLEGITRLALQATAVPDGHSVP